MAAVCHWEVWDDHHSMCHYIWLSLEINWWRDRLVPPMSSKVTASPCYRGSWSWTLPAQGASCPSIHSVQRADMNVQAVLKPVICQQSGWLICQSKWLCWLQKHHDTTWRHEKLWQQGKNDCLVASLQYFHAVGPWVLSRLLLYIFFLDVCSIALEEQGPDQPRFYL